MFVPLLTSHRFDLASLGNAVLAFFAFSAAASSAYLLNDILDITADSNHPTKRHRAIASGRLPITSALAAVTCLALASLVAAAGISGLFLATIVAYLVITVGYSLHLKKMLLVDIIALAGLYTTRILGGAIAINVHLSEWLLIFSLFVFTSLALIKRYGELTMRHGAGLADPVNRDYRISDLNIVAVLAGACGMNAITIFSLYISSPTVTAMYSSPALLWLLDPLLLYWIGRALTIEANTGAAELPTPTPMFEFLSHRRAWVDFRRGAAVLWSPSYYQTWRSRMDDVGRLGSLPERIDYASRSGIDYVIDGCDAATSLQQAIPHTRRAVRVCSQGHVVDRATPAFR